VQRQDTSFEWRLSTWRNALGAIRDRPLTGLGIGNYVLEQRAFSRHGQTREEVIKNGPSMEEQVHNEYLHIACELGLPGLLLYLLLLLAFFAKAWHALEQLPAGTTRILLLGCVAAIAAQVTDAVSNPAWRYPVCGLYFWLVLGMGTALVRIAARRAAESSGTPLRPASESQPTLEGRSIAGVPEYVNPRFPVEGR
jgi:putative inorganic carbon (HCO3(-)) transporter